MFFFFNDTATTEIYPLSLHDALPISRQQSRRRPDRQGELSPPPRGPAHGARRSEEHTSELQSHSDLVCRLLLEKKKRYLQRSSSPRVISAVPGTPSSHSCLPAYSCPP